LLSSGGTTTTTSQFGAVGSNRLVEFIGELGSVRQVANEGVGAAALAQGVVARSVEHGLTAEGAPDVDIARIGEHSKAALGLLEEESSGAQAEPPRSEDGARAIVVQHSNSVEEDARAEARADRAVPLEAVLLDVGVFAGLDFGGVKAAAANIPVLSLVDGSGGHRVLSKDTRISSGQRINLVRLAHLAAVGK